MQKPELRNLREDNDLGLDAQRETMDGVRFNDVGCYVLGLWFL